MSISVGHFSGNLGADATTVPAGNTTVTEGSIAVNKPSFGDKKNTFWVKFKVWGNRGEKLAPMLLKGTNIYITGEYTSQEWNGKSYPTIDCSKGDIAFMDKAKANSESTQRPQIEETITDSLDKLDTSDPFDL